MKNDPPRAFFASPELIRYRKVQRRRKKLIEVDFVLSCRTTKPNRSSFSQNFSFYVTGAKGKDIEWYLHSEPTKKYWFAIPGEHL